mmetsp:Transcript_71415/g.190395  ORF Transcript_71415/g.190395 Transcript_71415/m.190395 type:complete len:294 (+) Transcript_71415:69-950(+)
MAVSGPQLQWRSIPLRVPPGGQGAGDRAEAPQSVDARRLEFLVLRDAMWEGARRVAVVDQAEQMPIAVSGQGLDLQALLREADRRRALIASRLHEAVAALDDDHVDRLAAIEARTAEMHREAFERVQTEIAAERARLVEAVEQRRMEIDCRAAELRHAVAKQASEAMIATPGMRDTVKAWHNVDHGDPVYTKPAPPVRVPAQTTVEEVLQIRVSSDAVTPMGERVLEPPATFDAQDAKLPAGYRPPVGRGLEWGPLRGLGSGERDEGAEGAGAKPAHRPVKRSVFSNQNDWWK